jgi:hypothetical protein
MSLVKNGYEPHPTMLIGTFDEKTMLIEFDKDAASDPASGDSKLIIKVSYDKDPTATIGPAPAYELQSIKNLVDDTAMGINNTASDGCDRHPRDHEKQSKSTLYELLRSPQGYRIVQ